MEQIKRVAVITNYNITEKALAALTVADKFIRFGCDVLICLSARERINRLRRMRREFHFLPPDELYETADVLVVLGGDGSILEASRRAALNRTPILGINLGRLGFMAELEMDELKLLPRLFEGKYKIDERSMLCVTMNDAKGGRKLSSFALNDAVISNGSVARIVDLELLCGGESVTTYRADGLIIATPTGSTAYSMAAGGAITHPHLECFCVTPICPHSLAARPMVFPDSLELTVRNICDREKNLFLTIDGRTNYELYRGETVSITKSDKTTRLVTLKERGFYDTLRQKMTNGR